MIGGKVIFTYKRKRQLSRTDFYHDNELPNKSACTVSDTSATSNKHEGLLEDQKPENQKKDNYVDVPESFNKIKDEQLPEEYDTKESAICSHSQLENGPAENGCDKNPGNVITKDSYAEEMLAEDLGGPCSCIISSSELEHKCTKDSDLVDLKPSTETGLSEGTDPPSIDKPHSSCINAIGEKKFNSPLITFRRRSKRVKDVNGQGEGYSAVEASPSGTCSANLSINDTCSDGNAAKCLSIPGGQEKKASENVDSTSAPVGSAPENNAATKDEERVLSPTHLVNNIPPVAEAVVKTEQPMLFTSEGSECPSNDGLNTTRVSDGIGSNLCSAAFVDLPIPPRGSRFVVDCNKALEPDSDQHPIHTLSENLKNLNSSTEGIGEALSSEQPKDEKGIFVKAMVGEGTDPGSLTGTTSKKNYLQLFPEDRSNDMSPTGKSQLKPPAVEVYGHKSSLFSLPNVGFPSKEYIHENQRLLLLRHQMMLDNIVSRARAVEGNRFESPNLWLEEELDSLWVGVRRHGKGNWEAMLRDPRLQFLSWRTPWDLADRWQEEIRKLLNTLPVSEMNNCVRKTELLLLDRLNGLFRTKTGKENPGDDFQLSLGEIYSRPIDGFQNRSSMFRHEMNYQFQKPVSNTGLHRRPMFNNADPTTRAFRNGNIPHWLKDAVSVPPIPHDPSLHSLASSRTEQRAAGNNLGEFPQVTKNGKSESCQYRVDEKQNVIIIDSDASSEETISDDLSVVP